MLLECNTPNASKIKRRLLNHALHNRIMLHIFAQRCLFFFFFISFLYQWAARSQRFQSKSKQKKNTKEKKNTHQQLDALTRFGSLRKVLIWFLFYLISFQLLLCENIPSTRKKVHNKRQSSIMCAIVAQWPIYAWR